MMNLLKVPQMAFKNILILLIFLRPPLQAGYVSDCGKERARFSCPHVAHAPHNADQLHLLEGCGIVQPSDVTVA